MTSVLSILRYAFVWALIPLTVASSLPRMECRCSAAQGSPVCTCCKGGTCCGKACCVMCAKAKAAKQLAQGGLKRPSCCHDAVQSIPGGCCSLRHGPARTVAPTVELPQPMDDLALAVFVPVAANIAGEQSQHWMLERATRLPSTDRIIVFERLII